MYKIEFINPLECPDWDHSLQSLGDSTFFHSSAWARVLMESYGYTPQYIAMYQNGKIAGLVPFMEIKSVFTGKRGVSLPFSDYSSPIIPNESVFYSIFNRVVEHAIEAGWKYLEVRGGAAIPGSIPASRSYYVHTLRLSENEDEMLKRFKRTTRGNIKRAVRDKVMVYKCNSSESMGGFYRLNCMTRKKHGLPPQPNTFFKRVFDYVIAQNKGHIFLAHYRNKIIAGAIYFHMGRKVIWKYGASDPRYLNVRANNLVVWEAIKWYGRNGYDCFCFGRTEPGNRGLLEYKSGWDTKQEIVHYYRYDLINHEFVSSNAKEAGLHTGVFKLLPVGMLKLIGRLAYKHMG